MVKIKKILITIDDGPASEKVAEKWEADLIVLGAHGRTALSHLLMRRVAERVIRHSTKPLFIILTK